MTDTHTHILPGMDDGAKDLEESLELLAMCRDQGVETVVLTPHFYPDRESANHFLKRRDQAFAALQAAVTPDLPHLVLGAEVAWCSGIEHMEQIDRLTMGDSNYLLLEMPQSAWNSEQLNSVWRLATDGQVVPVLAHVERFLDLQRDGQFETLSDLQIPMQLSAGMFGKFFGRKKALRLLAQGRWMIGSDCHNTTSRPPCMAEAARYLQSKAPNLRSALYWGIY